MKDNPTYNEAAFGQWLHGYLTGLNSERQDLFDIAGGLERSSLLAWIESYCEKNKLNNFFEATNALVQELEKTGKAKYQDKSIKNNN